MGDTTATGDMATGATVIGASEVERGALVVAVADTGVGDTPQVATEKIGK